MKKKLFCIMCVLVLLTSGLSVSDTEDVRASSEAIHTGEFGIIPNNPAGNFNCSGTNDFINLVTPAIADYAGVAPTSTVTAEYIAEGWVIFEGGMTKEILLNKVNYIQMVASNVLQFNYKKLSEGWPAGSSVTFRKGAPFYYKNTSGALAYYTLNADYKITALPETAVAGVKYHNVKVEKIAYTGEFGINPGNPAGNFNCSGAYDFINLVTPAISDYAGTAPTTTVNVDYIANDWVTFGGGMTKEKLLDKMNFIKMATNNVLQFNYQKLTEGWPEGGYVTFKKGAPFYYMSTTGLLSYKVLNADYRITALPGTAVAGVKYHNVKVEKIIYAGEFSINEGNPAASLRCDNASMDFMNLVTSTISDYAGAPSSSTITADYIADGWVTFDRGMTKEILLNKVNSIGFATNNVIQFNYQKLGEGWPEGSTITLKKGAPFYYKNTAGAVGYVTLDAHYLITVNPHSGTDGKTYHTVKVEKFDTEVIYPDVYKAKRDTIELRNSQNKTDLSYSITGQFVKGSTIQFDLSTNTEKPVALWVLGEGDWNKSYYENGFVNRNGKVTIKDTIDHDVSKVLIYIQYRNNNYEKDTISDKTDYFTVISNISIDIPRADASGVEGDATGDGVVNVQDIVRTKRELAGLAGTGGISGASKDILLSGKHLVIENDIVGVKEIILRGAGATDYPIYLEDQEMMISAFQSPVTNEDITGGLTDSQIRAEFKKYTDAGFNTVYAQETAPFYSQSVIGNNNTWAVVDKYMDYAEDAGVDVILYSSVLTSYLKNWGHTQYDLEEEMRELWIGEDTSEGSFAGMKDRQNFAGLMMADEIHHSSLGYFETSVGIIKNLNPNIGILGSHISMDADCTVLTGAADPNGGEYTYNERAIDFAKFAKEIGTLSGTYKYGMYPLYDGSKSGYNAYDVNRLWLYNLQTLAKTAQENNFEMAMTLQGHGYSPYDIRKPETVRDIGFLSYTALAYGSKAFTYFTYGHSNLWTDENGSIQTNENIYNAVKEINEEIKSIDHVFLEFDWEGTMVDRDGSTEQMYYKRTGTYGSYDMETFYTSNDRIRSFQATEPALLGCFHDEKQNFDGFWLVNATNPYKNLNATITVKFNDATSLLIYDPASKDGKPHEITYNTTSGYSVNLASGKGIFIIPISG